MMWEIILLGRRVGLLIGRGQKRMSKEQIMLCFLGPIGYVQFVIHIELYKLRICSFSIFYKIFKLKHKRYISYHFFQFSKNLMNHMMSLPALQVQNGFLYNTHKATWSIISMCYFIIYFAQLIIFPFPCQYILMLSKLNPNSNWSIFFQNVFKVDLCKPG